MLHLGIKALVFLITFFFIVCLVLFVYSWLRLRAYTRGHVDADFGSPSDYGLEYHDYKFRTSDGVELSGWFIPAKENKAVVILVHGFSAPKGGKVYMLPHTKYLNDAGYSAFVIDLRGFGESEGNKKWLGVKEWRDLEAAYDFIKFFPENKDKTVGFLGVSQGATASIITVGRTGKGDFVIASVPYASLEREIKFLMKVDGFPNWFFVLLDLAAKVELGVNYDKYSAENVVGNIKVPLFLISARRDEVVNPEDAKLLYRQAKSDKELWEVDSGHLVFNERPEEFEKRALEFLNKL